MDAHADALRHSQHVMAALFGPPDERTFDVRYWGGVLERAGRPSAPYSLVVNHAGALRRMLLPAERAVHRRGVPFWRRRRRRRPRGGGDSRRCDQHATQVRACVGRHDATSDGVAPHSDAAKVVEARASRTVGRQGRRHEKARDRAAIRYHYDVGNDFYALWLDDQMVYSCAYYDSPDGQLEDAQVAKLDLVCRKLRLREGERLLDVGCGWGALVIHAAGRYGVTGLGVTLSEAQASLARERIPRQGSAIGVEWRSVTTEIFRPELRSTRSRAWGWLNMSASNTCPSTSLRCTALLFLAGCYSITGL